MTLSRDDQKEFEIFSSRVKEVLQHLLFEEADPFDVLSASLNDDDKINLMHVGELEAAAIVLGQNSNSLLDQNPKLAEAYQEKMQQWISEEPLSGITENKQNIDEKLDDLQKQVDNIAHKLSDFIDPRGRRHDARGLYDEIEDAQAELTRVNRTISDIRKIAG